jgi:hypothetical protein
MQTPRTEFAQALKAITTERGLDADVIIDTIKQAIIAAYNDTAYEIIAGTGVNVCSSDLVALYRNPDAAMIPWYRWRYQQLYNRKQLLIK